MPIYVKSLAPRKDLIILISLHLPHFVLEMRTKKEPRKPCGDNPNAKEHHENANHDRVKLSPPLWPTFLITLIWSNSLCFLCIFLFLI